MQKFALAASFALALVPGRVMGQVLLGPEFQVNSYATGTQASPSVAADASGNFVVVWTSQYQDGHASGVFGQRHDALGIR